VTLKKFMKIDMVTPDKTDINNNGGSPRTTSATNHAYADADYATRAKIWQEHIITSRGSHVLENGPACPEDIRDGHGRVGLVQRTSSRTRAAGRTTCTSAKRGACSAST
jgi:hypothetical protein